MGEHVFFFFFLFACSVLVSPLFLLFANPARGSENQIGFQRRGHTRQLASYPSRWEHVLTFLARDTPPLPHWALHSLSKKHRGEGSGGRRARAGKTDEPVPHRRHLETGHEPLSRVCPSACRRSSTLSFLPCDQRRERSRQMCIRVGHGQHHRFFAFSHDRGNTG